MFTSRIYSTWMEDIQREKITGILERVSPRGRVLDLGAGPGFLGRHVPGAVALDLDLENLRRAVGHRVLGDARRLPFKSSVFGTVFCIDSVHLFLDTRELRRVLSPGGEAVVTLFCSRYNRGSRLRELRRRVKGLRVKDEFFVGGRELDAVVVAERRASGREG
jgi:SAM-dependent methyltransferase